MGTPGMPLLAGVARGDRGLHRDRVGAPGLRRARRDRRLRQEHARLHDGDRAPRPAGRVRPTAARSAPAPSAATSSPCSRRSVHHARGSVSDRGLREVERTAIPAGQLRRHVPANTMASAIEALGMSLAEQLGAGGRLAPPSGSTPSAPGVPRCSSCGGESALPTSSAGGLRERDRDDHRPRGFDQRGPAPACHGP